jgi:hypothetical protein
MGSPKKVTQEEGEGDSGYRIEIVVGRRRCEQNGSGGRGARGC